MEGLGLSRTVSITVLLFSLVLVACAVFYFIKSAPPKTICIAGGPVGSLFEKNAIAYSNSFYNNHVGVTLKILTSNGSEENLALLGSDKSAASIGFVQGGITNARESRDLVSLGSLFYVPMFVFYRGAAGVTILSAFEGKRIAIGPPGSGTRSLATNLLGLNGINFTNATLMEMDADDAAQGLTNGTVDAAFLMGDSASSKLLRSLLVSREVQVMDFSQADAYVRRIPSLDKLELPMGSFDFGQNLPAHDLHLVGPTVELVARNGLHPALCDLLVETAQEIHGEPALLRRRDEFPKPVKHDFPLSEDALRFYKSGKGFLYRSLPFWVASLVNRILVAFVPVVLLLIPGLRLIPAFFAWRMRNQICLRYGMLLDLERDLSRAKSQEARNQLRERLKEIEASVNAMKLPSSFADQFYALRQHVDFVRSQISDKQQTP